MRARRLPLSPLLCLSLAACGGASVRGEIATEGLRDSRSSTLERRAPPKLVAGLEVEVFKVVDGDTIHVRRDGAIEKLRLLSVDTEEKLSTGSPGSASKPMTVFGEECALWAQELFAELAAPGRPARVGLFFPGGSERRDVYGRLLCHVILPDGRDYNRMLVELGKSPYFNKYGNSECDHDGFVAAQKAARTKRLGIWDPAVNRPRRPGAPSARRPYEKLLPWWDLRAAAIDEFRRRHAADADRTVDAGDAGALSRAARAGTEVDVFGEVDRLFDERGGDQTVLLRAEVREKAVRVRIPAGARARFEKLGLASASREYEQNFVWIRGQLREHERGFELRIDDPARVRRAGR